MQEYQLCIADGAADEASVLAEGLRLNNYSVHMADCGLDTIHLCEQGKVDLLILADDLPDVSGEEVIQRLRDHPMTAGIPIILSIPRKHSNRLAEFFKAGASDCFIKPYNLPMLMVRIDMLLRKQDTDASISASSELLMDSVYTDNLTGLRNRRYLLERLQEEAERAHRYNFPVSCLVLEVDEITALDEDLGATSLDDLLGEIALSMRSASRNFDILARYDGALFSAILPHTELEDAITYAKKIQDDVHSTTFGDPSFPTQATLNFGIVTCSNGSALGADFILGEAMRNLLRASAIPGEGIIGRDLSNPPENNAG